MEQGRGRYFFVADVHLGAAFNTERREALFVDFLRNLPEDTEGLYLLGDIFDFWVEYRDMVPRGFIRVFGALAALADRGVKIVFYPGNHDWWTVDYFEKELGARVVKAPYGIEEVGGLTICMGHGDGVGPRKTAQRLLYRLLRNRTCITLLKLLHPRMVMWFARRWSLHSRRKGGATPEVERLPLYKFAAGYADKGGRRIDAFIFGHAHYPARVEMPDGALLCVPGEWSSEASYLNLFGMYIEGRG